MKQLKILLAITLLSILACSSDEAKKQKGITLSQTEEIESDLGGNQEFKGLKTRPGKVLMTEYAEHKLISVFKVNYNKRSKEYFTGSNAYHTLEWYDDDRGTYYYDNFMPGIRVTYGYNMINVAHYNMKTSIRTNLFEKPVLINNVYYPSVERDSVNGKPILRDYYLVSVYDEDSNKDSLINHKDIRRLYYFDIDGASKTILIPKNYSVLGSQYDAQNDKMIIRAKLDENKDGQRGVHEAIHLFWIDMKNPHIGVRIY